MSELVPVFILPPAFYTDTMQAQAYIRFQFPEGRFSKLGPKYHGQGHR